MPIYTRSITIPKNTAAASPYSEVINPGEGIVTRVWVRFPRGCAGLVGVRLLDRSSQFAPLPAPGWLVADGETIDWVENRRLMGGPWVVTVEGYNTDTIYPHTLQVVLTCNNENYWDGRGVY